MLAHGGALFLDELAEFSPSVLETLREPLEEGAVTISRAGTAATYEALIDHTAHLGDLMAAILATGSVSGELLGEPSAELGAKLADSPVRIFTPYRSM